MQIPGQGEMHNRYLLFWTTQIADSSGLRHLPFSREASIDLLHRETPRQYITVSLNLKRDVKRETVSGREAERSQLPHDVRPT